MVLYGELGSIWGMWRISGRIGRGGSGDGSPSFTFIVSKLYKSSYLVLELYQKSFSRFFGFNRVKVFVAKIEDGSLFESDE